MTEYITTGTYRERNAEQLREWLAGRPRHNGAEGDPSGECCPDFSCCKPEYLAPLEEREAFVVGGDKNRSRMLGMFLGRLLSGECPEKKVHLTGGDPV